MQGRTFELRLDYEDGTFDVVHVSGFGTYAEAARFARDEDPEVVQVTWLASIDERPQRPLAF
jgi:hypothetical protein